MKKITLWYRYSKQLEIFKYNHYEHGRTDDILPKKTVIDGKTRWAREIAYMEGTTVKHLDEV